MTTVTKESLIARIAELEAGPRSLKEDYYLAVMRELLRVQEIPEVAAEDCEYESYYHGDIGEHWARGYNEGLEDARIA